ncbi:MAG TPA: hypothetical protein D7H92_06980 [Candidatus Poseidoniales archaeon]|nr:MAG TPA: hypothetical protein D7H92_06980 [Candidatus Poseidoniales archaeon]
MFECKICGLLSLGGTACPACGSQLRKDLSLEDMSGETLPTEVPGLDDAAAAWYDLEGIEPPPEELEDEEVPAPTAGSLPFGFQGESNVYDSRLPFGIGSFAAGIPFDSSQGAESLSRGDETGVESEPEPASEPEPEQKSTVPEPENAAEPTPEAAAPPVPELPLVEEVPPAPDAADEAPSPPPMPAPPGPVPSTPPPPGPVPSTPPPPGPVPLTPPPPAPDALVVSPEPVRLTTARLITSSPVQEEPAVPDYWKIDAQIPDYEQIYGQDEAVVEMEYTSFDDDVVVYDHGADSPAAVFHSPLEASPASNPQPSIKLQLHPAQAMRVDVGGSAPMEAALQDGFRAMQTSDWSSAARSFQKMAASMPTNAEVYNNYGIALLQRATTMRDGGDGQQQAVADTQFESSILALREAAKNAPTNGEILVNLAIALIESGRPEKALGIMNVHNARTPGSVKGLNTAAVAMFELGQLTQAVETLGKAGEDSVINRNLSQLSPKAALS